MARYEVSLRELREKLGLDVNARGYAECPFCEKKNKKRRTLKLTDDQNKWRCAVCGASGGVLHLYARYHLGIDVFPSDKEERSKISKSLYEFMGITDDTIAHRPAVQQSSAPSGPKRPVAPDAKLHAVYTAMAGLAVFQLTVEHKKELKKRGLTGNQIERNGYRTYPAKTYIPPEIVNLYNSVDPAIRSGLTHKDAAHIQFGLFVAKSLQELGHNLDGIPGFYKFGNHWCLAYLPGILIPTRNMYGEIVMWQVRRKFAPKYLTLSCGDRPGAVDDSVSRCHFPLSNDKPSDVTKLIFTEGPLKADVAKALSSDPCAYVAIPGIGNTKDLLRCCEILKKNSNITQIYNALDMDKLTNPNVRNGCASLCEALTNLGLRVIPMYWGQEYAAAQLMLYQSIAKARNVPIPPHDYRLSVYDKLNITAKALNDAKIDPGRQTEDSEYWESETKGIDDYLFSLLERKEHTHRDRTNHIRTVNDTRLRINAETTP